MKLGKYHVDKYGAWFIYKGDEVGFIWPWYTIPTHTFFTPFYSINFYAHFKSLKAIDNAWDGFWND
jgi:hypothetical protein